MAGAVPEVAQSFISVLGNVEISALSGDDAVSLLGVVASVENACRATKALLSRRIEACNAHVRSGHLDASSVVASVTGSSSREARSLLQEGRVLSSADETASRARAGRLSPEKLSEVTSGVAADPSAESELLSSAESGTVSDVRRVKASVVASSRLGPVVERRKKRYLAAHKRGDGLVSLSGVMTNEDWGQIEPALEERARRFFREAQKSGTHESHGAYLADALVDLITSGGGKSRAHVNVIVDYEVLATGKVDSGFRCEIAGVGPIAPDAVEWMLSDCLLNVLVKKGQDISSVATNKRYVYAAVQKALGVKPKVCSVRGCENTLGLERDHYRDFALGGPTSQENLSWLCPSHHKAKSAGWLVFVKDSGEYLASPGPKDRPPPQAQGPPGQLF